MIVPEVAKLLAKYYPPETRAHAILHRHGRQVAAKALAVAGRPNIPAVNLRFLEEAAYLHDIGVCFTAAPEIGCHGKYPYLLHGIKGREILEREGLPHHALVCERHIGVGLTTEDIRRQQLPLPERDMVPLSVEEQIIAYADLFFSKSPAKAAQEKSADNIRRKLARHGDRQVAVFDHWHRMFGG